MSVLKDLTWLTQLGFSILSPLLFCILGAVWLRQRCSLGLWVVFLGLALGLGGAFSAGTAFFRYTKQQENSQHKKTANPVCFNEHD